MRRPLVHRRFGRGAHRLAIGRPPGSPALDRLAESGGGAARIAPLAPVALAALLALGLDEERDRPTTTPPADTRDEPTRIAWVEWPDPIAPNRSKAPPTANDVAPRPDPEPTHASAAPPPASLPDARATPLAEADEAPRPTIDVASLLTAAPRVGATEGSAISPAAIRARAIAPVPGARRARPEDLAVLRGATPDDGVPSPMAATSAAPRDLGATRPDAAQGASDAPAAAREAMARVDVRADFLAGLEPAGEATEGRLAPPTALPPVAAKTPDAEIARRVRDDVAREARAAGWHEVPLDDLPDCSPPGRQDRLKQQIMRAAESQQTCRHAAGAYRFVETRNLNAFLMWSRTHPDVDAGSSGVRDACEVLSRALECLASSSTKELETR